VSNEGDGDSSPTTASSVPKESKPDNGKPKDDRVTNSEPLGAAFLTTTVETTKRKRKNAAPVRSIHDTDSSRQVDDEKEAPSVHSYHPASTVPRASTSIAMPAPRVRATSSRRSAAPAVGGSSSRYSSGDRITYTPVNPRYATEYETNPSSGYQDNDRLPAGGNGKKKKLSRKRQMEQMLRAGKLDEVQGDHVLQGVAHVYQQEGDHAALAAHGSSSNGPGVRVVPTGSYDASLGATAVGTDVTSRQKNSNQLNSLLANAASLENHRAQNPLFHSMGGGAGKSGSNRATAKRKYGW